VVVVVHADREVLTGQQTPLLQLAHVPKLGLQVLVDPAHDAGAAGLDARQGLQRPGVHDVGRARDRVAVRTDPRVAEQLDQVCLEVVADGVLEPAGLLVHLRPRHLEHVDEQQLSEPVPSQDRRGVVAAGAGQVQDAVRVESEVALPLEALDRLADSRGADAQAVHQPGTHREDPGLLELEDRLQVLLDGGVVTGALRPGLPLVLHEASVRGTRAGRAGVVRGDTV
jgi:hypothetical protein